MGEGEQLQDVEHPGTAGDRVEPQTAGGHRRVGQQHRRAFEQVAGVGRADNLGALGVGHGGARSGQDHERGGELDGGGGESHGRQTRRIAAGTEGELEEG